jgi:hypothetical protein
LTIGGKKMPNGKSDELYSENRIAPLGTRPSDAIQ